MLQRCHLESEIEKLDNFSIILKTTQKDKLTPDFPHWIPFVKQTIHYQNTIRTKIKTYFGRENPVPDNLNVVTVELILWFQCIIGRRLYLAEPCHSESEKVKIDNYDIILKTTRKDKLTPHFPHFIFFVSLCMYSNKSYISNIAVYFDKKQELFTLI